MDTTRARQIAERVHARDREPDGSHRLSHVRRVVAATPVAGHSVAWLHEVLETGVVSEQQLLLEGLDHEELRALRLLCTPRWSRSAAAYRAHVELIARAAGRSGQIARLVAIADLSDRCARPGAAGTPYARALRRLLTVTAP